jgi:hypothetical protein
MSKNDNVNTNQLSTAEEGRTVQYKNEFVELPITFTYNTDSKIQQIGTVEWKNKTSLSRKGKVFQMHIIAKINELTHSLPMEDIGELKQITLTRKEVLNAGITGANYVRDLASLRTELRCFEFTIKLGRKKILSDLSPGEWVIEPDKVTLPVSEYLVPMFSNFKGGGFNKYYLSDLDHLENVYSIPFYNFFTTKLFGEEYELTLEIDFIRDNILGITKEGKQRYSEYKYLNRDILKPVFQEINSNTSIHVEILPPPIKIGRRIVALNLRLRKNESIQPKLPMYDDVVLISDEIKSLLDEIGFNHSKGKPQKFILAHLFEDSEEAVLAALKSIVLEAKKNNIPETVVAGTLYDELPNKIIELSNAKRQQTLQKQRSKKLHKEKLLKENEQESQQKEIAALKNIYLEFKTAEEAEFKKLRAEYLKTTSLPVDNLTPKAFEDLLFIYWKDVYRN